MKKTTTAFLLGSALILGSACASPERDGDGDGDGDGSGSGDGDGDGDGSGTLQRCNKMDLVFVVDDSGSMSEEQGNLGHNFPQFAQVLQNFVDSDGNALDFRIAVTTTGKTFTQTITMNITGFPGGTFPPQTQTISEMGDNGAFRNNCGITRPWLEVGDNLDTALPCRASVGTSGPGTEMPLITTKLSLDERVQDGTNAGFLRDDALLGVVMLTDEDDSSVVGSSGSQTITVDFSQISNPPTPDPITDFEPEHLVQFLDAKKGHRSRWAAGVIAGQTACTSTFGDAVEATRLKEFVDLANAGGTQQAVFSSICDGDLSAALTAVVDKFQNACGNIIL